MGGSHRLCVSCGERLGWRMRADARYCGNACRQAAHRRRAGFPPEIAVRTVNVRGADSDYFCADQPPLWVGADEVTYSRPVGCASDGCARTIERGLRVRAPDDVPVGIFCGEVCFLDFVYSIDFHGIWD